VVGTGELVLVPQGTSYPLIPGLTTQVTLTSEAFVYATTHGGVSMAADGESLVRVILFVNNLPVNGQIADLMAASASGAYTLVRWNHSAVVRLPPGTHKIEVRATIRPGSATAYVSGSDDTETMGRQGSLTTLILQQ